VGGLSIVVVFLDFNRIMLVRPESRCGWGFMFAPLAINLEYIAAFIEKDVEAIKIVNQEFDTSDIRKHMDEFNPDFVGITTSATDHLEMKRICKIAKRKGIATGVGGYHPTAIPDEIMKNSEIDLLFRGESELTLKELINKGTPEDIQGLTYRKNGKVVHNPLRPLIENLDLLPFPARHLRAGDECDRWVSRGGAHRDQIHTSRGCWGRCTFCCEPSMSRSHQRYRSPENVFEEIKQVYKLHGEENLFILFGDPHLMGKPERIGKLSDMLIKEDMDITFTAMVRADSICQRPEIVEKMVKAGIIGYCMGVESPFERDLKGTKKGISNKIQEEAVHILRRNNAVAGGTIVIGLPGQTEEDILTFPEYARHLGMVNSAYPVVTPQAGTEFYAELDSKGLIDVRDWTKYDQMHSVFRHDSISKERFEELLTHCTGRFYAPDIFIDDMIMAQNRNDNGCKMSISKTIQYMRERADFALQSGPQYRPKDAVDFGAIFIRAQINPWTRIRTKMIGIHNVVELEPFLKLFGNQKIQITVAIRGKPFAYYVLKTTKNTVEYIDVCERSHSDVTLNFYVELTDLHNKRSQFILKTMKKIIKHGQLTNMLRAMLAGFAYHIAIHKSNKPAKPITLPSEYTDSFFKLSGWKDKKIKDNAIHREG